MAIVTLKFPLPINVSVDVGDEVYFVDPTETGGFNVGSGLSAFGTITSIQEQGDIAIFTVDTSSGAQGFPDTSSFILFSKNKQINSASAKGYYANVKFVNNSETKAEMYSTSCDVIESSK
jgi:hypothetical protein